MAQFNYNQWSQQRSTNQTSGERKEFDFMGTYLKNDGDSVVVRFPYKSMDDLVFESTHLVVGVFPNDKYGKRVCCSGDDACPLCSQGIKRDIRCAITAVAYIPDNGKVVQKAVIWDRPGMFADTDIKTLITEYGDLTQHLFKIKRTGSGTATRYSTNIIMNKAVYPDALYPVDFSVLEGIDASKILFKSLKQYETALNGDTEEGNEVAQTTQVETKVEVEQVQKVEQVSQPVQQPSQPIQQPTQQSSGVTRYRF